MAEKIKHARTIQAEWRVHTPNLLNEIMQNRGTSILLRPLQIFGRILFEVGERAAQLNDPELNALMCRLAIYEIADPEQNGHDKRLTEKTINAGRTAKQKRLAAEKEK